MKCLLVAIACLITCSRVGGLVHYMKLAKGQNGCKSPKGAEMAVGAVEQDDKTCGAITCQSTEGDAFVHFCQIPATFAECVETAVLTNVDFPQCCWTCAAWANCDGGGAAPGAGGEAPAEGAPADGAPPPAARTHIKNQKNVASTADTMETTTESERPRTRGKWGAKRSTTLSDESEFPEGDVNIRFGGGTPISKFGEDSI
ncbi:uncharacterized protein LOC6548490 [Drosophila erecta]|uniref:Single domain-containing protein n=1 Tax=Drosophila erecta TaxID=7220 RepID=A0A0Q5W0P7_DROER|nr:uncharacterized protein LOC6548490 [Drosophila erecta]KQS62408.1 uncharacterized protein Dere_GG20633 [Drosophila erecta]